MNARLEELTGALGVDFFGVADLLAAHRVVLAQGGPLVSEFPRAVSIGIVLFHAVVDQLPRRTDRAVAMNYRHHCYDLVNQRLDHIASQLSGVLQRDGHRALPVPASQTVDKDQLWGLFSHKLAAHLAGLGWIGKSCLLVTPGAGPRVRWATVLTDAPLRVTGEPMDERCGDCQECVEICPPGAFTGRRFREDEPRRVRFAAHKCNEHMLEREQSVGLRVCGLCLYVCPHGRKRRQR